jgi:hypothetical protein
MEDYAVRLRPSSGSVLSHRAQQQPHPSPVRAREGRRNAGGNSLRRSNSTCKHRVQSNLESHWSTRGTPVETSTEVARQILAKLTDVSDRFDTLSNERPKEENL